MKIGVMGAGAIGCWVGGRLVGAGADVVFVGREATKTDVERAGLDLVDVGGARLSVEASKLRFETEVSALADCDVVLCCLKSAATADAAEQLDGVLSKDAIVVSMQNGIRAAEDLRRSKRTVLAGVVGFNVLPKGGGAFHRLTTGRLFVEHTSDPRGAELATLLGSAGFEVEVPPDIRRVQWAKLLVNLNNAISALSGAPTKELVLSAGYRKILASLIDESLSVLRAAKIRPAKIMAIPVTMFPMLLRLPTPIVRAVARSQLRIDPEARSSMWEDLERGRPTEVDFLNGEVVRLAESCGVDAPLNRRIVALVHEAERAGKGSPNLPAGALAARIGG
jgi:2-dehydropantoate 2-reductase